MFSVDNEIKNKISENKVKHRNILLKHLSEVRKTETLIRDSLSAFKELDESNVVSWILEYKPRNKEFSKLPPKVNVSLPAFHSKPLNGEQIDKMFGSLKLFKTIQDENGYSFKQFGGIHR